jgi:hypothetical protein
MTSSKLPPSQGKTPTRDERQAQALRENLRKRKSQQRGRREEAKSDALTPPPSIDYKNEETDLNKET